MKKILLIIATLSAVLTADPFRCVEEYSVDMWLDITPDEILTTGGNHTISYKRVKDTGVGNLEFVSLAENKMFLPRDFKLNQEIIVTTLWKDGGGEVHEKTYKCQPIVKEGFDHKKDGITLISGIGSCMQEKTYDGFTWTYYNGRLSLNQRGYTLKFQSEKSIILGELHGYITKKKMGRDSVYLDRKNQVVIVAKPVRKDQEYRKTTSGIIKIFYKDGSIEYLKCN